MRLGVAAAVTGGRFVPGDVEVQHGRVVAVGVGAPAPGGLVAVPGFVDLQVNGAGGADLLAADAGGWRRCGEALLAAGTTAFRPTFVTAPEARLVAALRSLPTAPGSAGPRLLGAHLEGPFLAPGRIGAHDPEHRRDPDAALLARLLAAGPVAQLTLAPELPGALDVVRRADAAGILVALGHSDATAAQALAAVRVGARAVTHWGNAMPPARAREPGLAGVALARRELTVTVIADGVHVHPDLVGVVRRAARGAVAFVSDAVAPAGTDAEAGDLAGAPVVVRDGAAWRPDGTLAGAVALLDAAVRRQAAAGAPLPALVAAASTVPALLAGRPDLGRLEPGVPADVAVLDDRLEVVRTLVAGEERFARV